MSRVADVRMQPQSNKSLRGRECKQRSDCSKHISDKLVRLQIPQLITKNGEAELDVSEKSMPLQYCLITAYKQYPRMAMCGVTTSTNFWKTSDARHVITQASRAKKGAGKRSCLVSHHGYSAMGGWECLAKHFEISNLCIYFRYGRP